MLQELRVLLVLGRAVLLDAPLPVPLEVLDLLAYELQLFERRAKRAHVAPDLGEDFVRLLGRVEAHRTRRCAPSLQGDVGRVALGSTLTVSSRCQCATLLPTVPSRPAVPAHVATAR